MVKLFVLLSVLALLLATFAFTDARLRSSDELGEPSESDSLDELGEQTGSDSLDSLESDEFEHFKELDSDAGEQNGSDSLDSLESDEFEHFKELSEVERLNELQELSEAQAEHDKILAELAVAFDEEKARRLGFKKLGKKIKSGGKKAGKKIKSGGKKIKSGGKKAGKKIKSGGKKAGKKIKKGGKKAGKKIKKGGKKAGKKIKKGGKKIKKKIKNKKKKNKKKKGPSPGPAPTIGEVTGDPHFVMWSGHKYDFHGGCDLVLVRNPDFNNGQGLYIHIRTKIQRWWSFVESAVVQIGEDTLEVMGGVNNKRHFVNGRPGERLGNSKPMTWTIGGYHVRYRNLNTHQFQFKIFLENDQNIVLKAVKDFMRVDIENPTVEDFGNSVGLMGSFETGEMLARNGTVLEDSDDFGKEWQVHRTEPMLFHSVEGVQHPETCAMPKPVQEERRRLEGSISREQAELACAKVSPDQMKDCVYDVMATNDVDMAGAF